MYKKWSWTFIIAINLLFNIRANIISDSLQFFEEKGDYYFKKAFYDSSSILYKKGYLQYYKLYNETSNLEYFKKYTTLKRYKIFNDYLNQNDSNILYTINDLLKESILKLGENNILVADIYRTKGIILNSIGEYEEASLILFKALEIYKINSDIINIAKCRIEIGNVNASIGKYNKAINQYKEALPNIKRKDEELTANCYYNIASAYIRNNNIDSSNQYISYAIQLYDELYIFNHPNKVLLYNVLGFINFYEGNYQSAKINYNKANNIIVETGNENNIIYADVYNNLANLYSETGEYNSAIFNLKKAEQVYSQNINNHPKLIDIYINLGNIYSALGNYAMAFKYYKKALRNSIYITEKKPLIADIKNNIGVIYYKQNKLDSAYLYFYDALFIKQNIVGEKYPDIGNCYINIGNIYFDKKQNTLASNYYNKALNIFIEFYDKRHPDVSLCYINLAKIKIEESNYYDALGLIQKAIIADNKYFNNETDLNKIPPVKSFLNNKLLLTILNMKAKISYQLYKESLNQYYLTISYNSILKCDSIINQLSINYDIYNDKFEFVKTLKQYYTNAILISEELKTQQFNNDTITSMIFSFSEKNKAAILLQELNEYNIYKFYGIPDSIIQKEKMYKHRIDYYNRKIQDYYKSDNDKAKIFENEYISLNEEYQNYITYLSKNYPQYFSVKYTSKSVKINDIKEQLKDNEALIEYYLARDFLNIIVITNTELFRFNLSIDSTFETTILHYYESIINDEISEYIDFAINASKLLYEPIREIVEKKQKLIIIPDNYLYYIPFDALIINSKYPRKIDFSKLDYLVKSFSITCHYSATSWYNARIDTLQNQFDYKFVGFAPIFNNTIVNDSIFHNGISQKISYLPYSKSEIDSIIKLFSDRNSISFYNEEANEYNFYYYGTRSKFLHIATHGSYLTNSNPTFLLWPDSIGNFNATDNIYINDGIVRIEEIYNTKIKSDLVVLSTCESGQGIFMEGEGIMSLTRSFLIAGAKNIVYTMWPIDDKITSQFMFMFYQNIIQGNGISVAMQEAKLQLISNPKYSFPRIWCSYYLLGI